MSFLFFLYVLVPLSAVVWAVWRITQNILFLKLLGYFWIGLIFIVFIGFIMGMLKEKKVLHKKDYYGKYVIYRECFPGEQADWQYTNFRFEIKENDSIYFHVTSNEKLIKTYRGTITTTKPYNSERLIINMSEPTHHILLSNPTTIRSSWDFYLVFYSPKFNNVFFKKGDWKPIETQ